MLLLSYVLVFIAGLLNQKTIKEVDSVHYKWLIILCIIISEDLALFGLYNLVKILLFNILTYF